MIQITRPAISLASSPVWFNKALEKELLMKSKHNGKRKNIADKVMGDRRLSNDNPEYFSIVKTTSAHRLLNPFVYSRDTLFFSLIPGKAENMEFCP